MGGCGRRGGWARAGDTAGGRAGLGGRAAARLLGRDGCWGSALCKAGRTRQRGSEAPSFYTPWPSAQPFCSIMTSCWSPTSHLAPPSLASHELQVRTASREVYRIGILTTAILPYTLHPQPSSLPFPSAAPYFHTCPSGLRVGRPSLNPPSVCVSQHLHPQLVAGAVAGRGCTHLFSTSYNAWPSRRNESVSSILRHYLRRAWASAAHVFLNGLGSHRPPLGGKMTWGLHRLPRVPCHSERAG